MNMNMGSVQVCVTHQGEQRTAGGPCATTLAQGVQEQRTLSTACQDKGALAPSVHSTPRCALVLQLGQQALLQLAHHRRLIAVLAVATCCCSDLTTGPARCFASSLLAAANAALALAACGLAACGLPEHTGQRGAS